jgi:hypothetical protein
MNIVVLFTLCGKIDSDTPPPTPTPRPINRSLLGAQGCSILADRTTVVGFWELPADGSQLFWDRRNMRPWPVFPLDELDAWEICACVLTAPVYR